MRYGRHLVAGVSLWLLVHAAGAAEMELQLELPDMRLLLEPVTDPLLQREGSNLIYEQILISEELAPLVLGGKFEEALDMLRQRRDWLLTLLESGDPGEELRQRAVPGGMSFGIGSGLVSAQLLLLTGQIYFQLERYQPAENAFRAALEVLPDFVRAHESLGLLLLRLERYDEAREQLTRAIELGMNTPNVYGALGYIHFKADDYWAATSAFEKAMMLDSQNTNWQRGLLQSLAQSDQYQSGRVLVEQMLLEAPDEPDLWVYRAHLSLLSNQRRQALTSLETAIRLGDRSVANLQACASLHLENGSVERAVELLDGAFGEGMEYRYIDQAVALLTQRQEWDDIERLLDAVEPQSDELTDEEQSLLLTRRASVLDHDGNADGARDALENAVALDPANGDALMSLAQNYTARLDYNRADLLYQRASAFADYRENALISMAQLAIDQENYERALDLLRQVVANNPIRTDLQRNIDSLENLVLLQTQD